MQQGTHDPVTGQMTTGHEWNGIEELETPIPRVVLFFLAAAILFSIGYWILMPAWPIGDSYTKGVLGVDQRRIVTEEVAAATAERAAWTTRVATEDFATLTADAELMRHVGDTGRTLFQDNCAVCHGTAARGGPGFPNLADKAWLWGGEPETLAETIRVGINADHPDTRISQMLAFGRDGILSHGEIRGVGAYVRSLSGQALTQQEQAWLGEGEALFIEQCAACHGEDGRGETALGAPDLTDDHWIYGGDAQAVFTTIQAGRQGHMPHWEGRLTATDIKLLALYLTTLGEQP